MNLEMLQKIGRAGIIKCRCGKAEYYSKEEIMSLDVGLCRECFKIWLEKIKNKIREEMLNEPVKTWKSLSPEEKELANQMKTAGLSYREISESFGVSYESTRKSMYRGLTGPN
jgi:DNA-directed RNA polymerase specialized sigma24 family protein